MGKAESGRRSLPKFRDNRVRARHPLTPDTRPAVWVAATIHLPSNQRSFLDVWGEKGKPLLRGMDRAGWARDVDSGMGLNPNKLEHYATDDGRILVYPRFAPDEGIIVVDPQDMSPIPRLWERGRND